MLMRSRQREHEEIATVVNGLVTRSLAAVGDPIGKCIPTRIETDPSPIRLNVEWRTAEPEPGRAFGPAGSTILLRSASVETAVESRELVARFPVPTSSWSDSRFRRRLVTQVRAFVEAFRETEMRLILRLLPAGRPVTHMPSVAAVRQAVARVNGASSSTGAPDRFLCRLLANGQLVADAQAFGVVEDAVDVKSALPEYVGAMVIPTICGPVVDRIVDDVTIMSCSVDDAVVFTLAQRFFLTNTDRVEVLAPFAFPPGGSRHPRR